LEQLVAGELQWKVSHELRIAVERVVRQLTADNDMSTEAEEDIVSSCYLAKSGGQKLYVCCSCSHVQSV
jgi:hypothetical protein